jgi:hypothetical protein
LIVGIPTAQVVDVLVEYGEIGTLKQRPLDSMTLTALGVLWILRFFAARAQVDGPTRFGRQPLAVSTTHLILSSDFA